jgi:polysaccharide export outer membrane protein
VDVISMAGGLQPNAGDEVAIQRVSPEGTEQTITVDLRRLLENGDLALNVVVQGGDVIHVKERVAETVFVVGEVNRSGAYAKPPRQEIRVTQVIAWAGGALKTASMSKGILVRYHEDGVREELPVDFAAIMKGQKPDIFVRANDIVFVPGSKSKNLGYTLLNAVPGILTTMPYYIIP